MSDWLKFIMEPDYLASAHDQAELDNLIGDICLYLNSSDLPDVCDNTSEENNSFVWLNPTNKGSEHHDFGGYGDTFYKEMGLSLLNKIILSGLYSVILVTALLGNGLVLVTVTLKRSLWKPMNFFISSLAISDVVLGLSCIPINIALIVTTEWTLGSVSCRSLPFFMNLGSNCSMLTLCCMAVERFVAIVHPIKFNAVHTLGKTLLVLMAVWLLAIATASPFALYYESSKLCGRYLPSGECEKCFQSFGSSLAFDGEITQKVGGWYFNKFPSSNLYRTYL
ncbi:gastrin/cholecystokinin type b receptor-like [Plakobranchus ocellatus]|uniref:Gastrin/cholecystokinin type b receptor-like n=1 Tax=Plakobranchus ocellatus TaxID=259542 RepID=A0AAV4D2G7_9GAST|nr:gastrin/cholecystokinin type b receptor-like [Plakobranchus ocellatus]